MTTPVSIAVSPSFALDLADARKRVSADSVVAAQNVRQVIEDTVNAMTAKWHETQLALPRPAAGWKWVPNIEMTVVDDRMVFTTTPALAPDIHVHED